MKSFSINGPAVKAFFGLNAKTFGNPTGGGSKPPAPLFNNYGLVVASGAPGGLATDGAGNVIIVSADNPPIIYKSADGGKTWANIGTGQVRPAGTPDTFYVAFGAGAYVSPIKNGEIEYSLNGGISWSTIPSAMQPDPNNPGVVAFGNGIFLVGSSQAGGDFNAKSATGTSLWSGENPTFAIDPGSIAFDGAEFVMLSATTGGLVITTADGVTYDNSVQLANGANDIAYDSVHGVYCYSVSPALAEVCVAPTLLALETAPPISLAPAGMNTEAVVVYGGGGYLIAQDVNNHTAVSTNGGLHWTTLDLGGDQITRGSFVYDAVHHAAIIVTAGGVVFSTAN